MNNFFKRRDELVNEVLTESLLKDSKDLYLNFEDFESGIRNVCLVTGIVGSNYRSLGYKLGLKYKAIVVDLSDVYHMPEEKDRDMVLKQYLTLKRNANLEEKMKTGNITKEEFNNIVYDYTFFSLYIAKANPKYKFIVMGPEIFWNYKYIENIESYPIIFTNTSLANSIKHDIELRVNNGESKVDVIKELIAQRKIYKRDYDIVQQMQKEFKILNFMK